LALPVNPFGDNPGYASMRDTGSSDTEKPDYDKSMAIAGWLVISLVLWGVLLLVLI